MGTERTYQKRRMDKEHWKKITRKWRRPWGRHTLGITQKHSRKYKMPGYCDINGFWFIKFLALKLCECIGEASIPE